MIMIVIAKHVRSVSCMDWDIILDARVYVNSIAGRRAFRMCVRRRLMYYLVEAVAGSRGGEFYRGLSVRPSLPPPITIYHHNVSYDQ